MILHDKINNWIENNRTKLENKYLQRRVEDWSSEDQMVELIQSEGFQEFAEQEFHLQHKEIDHPVTGNLTPADIDLVEVLKQ